jgi:hypothetical protein
VGGDTDNRSGIKRISDIPPLHKPLFRATELGIRPKVVLRAFGKDTDSNNWSLPIYGKAPSPVDVSKPTKLNKTVNLLWKA